MAVKIRLARRGRRNAPFYRLVVADSRSPRDGRFIEIIGQYQPIMQNEEDQLKIDEEKAIKWLMNGAQPTDTARSLLRKFGVMKKFHELKVEQKKAGKAGAAAE